MKRRPYQPERPLQQRPPGRWQLATLATVRHSLGIWQACITLVRLGPRNLVAAARPPELNEADKALGYIEKPGPTGQRRRGQHAAQVKNGSAEGAAVKARGGGLKPAAGGPRWRVRSGL